MKFSELVEKVKEVDKDAAQWLIEMENEGSNLLFVMDDDAEIVNSPEINTLSGIMLWFETPQGFKYWSQINKKLL